MTQVKKGDRVGAIRENKDGHLYLYGYGVYQGNRPLPEGFGLYAGLNNPCIELDSGELVFGIQCWWASEREVKEYEKYADKVIMVSSSDDIP